MKPACVRTAIPVVGILGMMLLSGSAQAVTITVPTQATTIMEGIDLAASGDTVLVLPGDYPEYIDFGGKEIVLRSEAGPEVTTILGESQGTMITIQNGEGRDLVIEGFTIRHEDPFGSVDFRGIRIIDSSPTIRGNIIRDNRAGNGYADDTSGAGIYATGLSSPWIAYNTIESNIGGFMDPNGTSRGGGLCLIADGALPEPAYIAENYISDNSVYGSSGYGGGVYVEVDEPSACIFENNMLVGNSAAGFTAYGGGAYVTCHAESNTFCWNQASTTGTSQSARGGGLYLLDSRATARDNAILHNRVVIRGGTYMTGSGGGVLSNGDLQANVIAFNVLELPEAPGGERSWYDLYGGGVDFHGDTLASNTIYGNVMGIHGSMNQAWGAGTMVWGQAEVSSNIIAMNAFDGYEGDCGGIYFDLTPSSVECNDVWNNADCNYHGITDPTGLDGNISADPMLCDPGNDDFTLHAASPCAQENNPECGQIGALPVGCGYADMRESRLMGASGIAILSWPNPVRGITHFTFHLPWSRQPMAATVKLYDIGGHVIRTLVAEDLPPGTHEVAWDGANAAGERVPAGTYYCRVACGGREAVSRVLIVR